MNETVLGFATTGAAADGSGREESEYASSTMASRLISAKAAFVDLDACNLVPCERYAGCWTASRTK